MSISERRQLGIILNDARHVMRIVKNNPHNFSLVLQEEGYQTVQKQEKILNKAMPVTYPKKLPPFIKKRLLTKKITILKYNSDYYFQINLPDHHVLVKNRAYSDIFYWLFLAYLAVIAIIAFIYTELKRALKPIKNLELEIKKFGDGSVDIDTRSDKKDEIASVGNQFYNAVQKINLLQNTRTLFLRNMMHELKTPITKGKLSLSLMEENSESAMLERVFHKLDALINEMADIERITTQNITIEKNRTG